MPSDRITMSTKPIHRIFLLVSIASFFGSTALSAGRIINSAPNPYIENNSVEAQRQLQAAQLQLKEQEQGYKYSSKARTK